jgi:hypothetical protein
MVGTTMVYEFWFYGLSDPQDPEDSEPYSFHGTTTDFLEFCCQLTQKYNSHIAGEFIAQLMNAKEKDLEILRVVDWKFEVDFAEVMGIWPSETPRPLVQKRIILHHY